LIGGIDMDGGLYGPGLPNGTDKPFMFVGRENHTRENRETDPILSWQTECPSLRGWKRHVIVVGALHNDFSDYPILFEQLGISPMGTVATENIYLGVLKGTRAMDIVTDYVGAFLDFIVHGKPSRLLDGPVEECPGNYFRELTFHDC
jgi:hypothetical protein